MFFGSFVYALDDKGRLVIPAKMRGECGSTLFAMRGFEQCLSLYPAKNFDDLVAKLSQYDYLQADVRPFVRLALSSVLELSIDSHGRIQLPVDTLKQYKLSKQVSILGVQDHLELWDLDTWTNYEKNMQDSYDHFGGQGEKK